MKTSDFNYSLPEHLIAQFPVPRRSDSKMMVIYRDTGEIIDSSFSNIGDFIDASYFLVVNNSKVFKARLRTHRATGGAVEIFLVRRIEGTRWLALLQPSARLKQGEVMSFDDCGMLIVCDDPGRPERLVEFPSIEDEHRILAAHGQTPLPPYIDREPEDSDQERYQTVYARRNGSVAAPTAGLHFTPEILNQLNAQGIAVEEITLHVGPGTFKPVQADNIQDHAVDPEMAEITLQTADSINCRKQAGKKLLAVGTTTVRTIEAVAGSDGRLPDGIAKMVSLYIYPPYRFKMVDALLTNFHLPKSSLLMLVSAFYDREKLLAAYAHAIENNYRFYSYGDCMLIL